MGTITLRLEDPFQLAVDRLGEFRALVVAPANALDRAQVGELARAVQLATEETVAVSFVDQGYIGEAAEQAENEHSIRRIEVKLEEARQGFVLVPRRWIVECSFAWLSRFRWLAKDDERLVETVAGLHLGAFAALVFHRLIHLLLGQNP